MATTTATPGSSLAREVRAQFVFAAGLSMAEVGQAVQSRLTDALTEPGPALELQQRRNAWSLYKAAQPVWVQSVISEWQTLLSAKPLPQKAMLDLDQLELVSTEMVDEKIAASRLTEAVLDRCRRQYDDLQVRIKHLEAIDDLPPQDVLRPDVLLSPLIRQWGVAGMPRGAWSMVSAVVQNLLRQKLLQAYTQANRYLKDKDVVRSIDAGYVVKKAPEIPLPEAAAVAAADTRPAAARHRAYSPFPVARTGRSEAAVIGQIRKLLAESEAADRAHTGFQAGGGTQLATAIAALPKHDQAGSLPEDDLAVPQDDAALVTRLAHQLRNRSAELKKSADSSNEKATIEIVALMFQAILQDERVPTSIRVWFARLQIPVLRIALDDPEFLGSMDHPARQLIDRMGSCVLGLDASGVHGNALEAEVRRIVQVVEQYVDTGKQVYELVLDEFQAFLASHLTEGDSAQQLVSVAQQLEQKETLAIQYTIEMRDLFNRVPVPEDIRQFLYKVWVEVMAVAAVRQGAQHTQTLALRKVAGDLMSLSSAKSARAERMLAMRELPSLLERLRQGMTLMGVASSEQDIHLKTINDALAQSFLSKAQALTPAHIQEIARRLADLEEFVGNEDVGDLPLDTQSVEWMLGPQASGSIEVIVDGGSKPTLAMVEWARDMLTGSWFVLDHNGRISNVQFLWRSAQRHLNLFASTDGRSYVIQSGRLASYLQAGLLKPQEDEPLTLRAARDALAKIEANPERLLQ